ncbi:HNH endonuclease signature motif containing protein [Pseudonocardia sp.]|uniref:HNH endonuclease signature motif containing protein n=1 Tax=Pseudonocardia sp. TaxID=60912 RepID=UPI002621F830|nr:HNH endonuclease signature motif containing protein [Pseudonocardia sp.]
MQQMAGPDALAGMPPGPGLAAALAAVDAGRVPPERAVEVLRARYRQLAHEQAGVLAAMVAVSRAVPGSAERAAAPQEWAAGEIAAALTLTAGSAGWELSFAETLVTALPLVHAALAAGRIDRAKARVFADHLGPDVCELTGAQVAALCGRFLPMAPALTARQLAARILRAVLAIDPGAAARRYRRAVRERGVSLYLGRDGAATLVGDGLPAAEAAAAAARLDRLAATARRAGCPGGLAAISADLYLGMLDGSFHGLAEAEIVDELRRRRRPEDEDPDDDSSGGSGAGGTGDDARAEDRGESANGNGGVAIGTAGSAGTPGGVSGVGAGASPATVGGEDGSARASGDGGEPRGVRDGIEVRVGLGTLLGHDERPGEIAGLGPVTAPAARAAVAAQRLGAEWRFAVTGPTGELSLAGVLRRRPARAGSAPTGSDRSRGGVVEISVPAAELADLVGSPGPWRGVVEEIAARYADRDRLLTRLDDRAGSRFVRGALARHVQVRDRTCIHPGCDRPAVTADLDHTRDVALGGTSTEANVGPTCRRHHRYKHDLGWRLCQPSPGCFEWTSPLGRVYRTRGEPIHHDLPPPVPGPVEPPAEDAGGTRLDVPILWRPTRRTAAARPVPAGPPTVDRRDDDPPPF